MRLRKRKKVREQSTSDVLHGVVSDHDGDYITLREIKFALHERGFGLLMIFFALPLSVPIPLPPGVTAIPAIPLLLFSIQMVLRFDSPWLPDWVANKSIKRELVASVIEKASPYVVRVESFLRPRLSFAASQTGECVVGVFCFVFALSIAVPLPLTNFIPAAGISLMSLGLISKDGVPVILGMVVGSCGVTLTTLILIFGKKFVMGLFSFLPF